MKKHLFILLLLSMVLESFGANEPIKGIVLDANTKEALPFANIAVADRYFGTVSNSEGRFVLNREGINSNDTIVFSYVGYETLKIGVTELQEELKIYLTPAVVNLAEIQVLSRTLSAKEIVELIEENYEDNYPKSYHKQRVFIHKYEKTPFPDENQIIVKKSNFEGLDKNTFQQFFEIMPDEFVEYQDALVDLYSKNDKHKLLPISGISLEEASMQDLSKEMEDKLSVFFKDIEATKNQPDIYYKFRTGIFAAKMDTGGDESYEGSESSDSTTLDAKEIDTLNYHIQTSEVKSNILNLFRDYTQVGSKNWEFINSPGKYRYELGEVTIFDDEVVYEISFSPKGRGLFEGVMYVSTSSYAILQLDFAYSEGKKSENIHLLGIGHSMNYKKGRVIFEKDKVGYFAKYIYAEQHETASIERNFSIMKKKKRFFIDKELNEIKFDVQLFFDINSFWEVLVMDRDVIDPSEYDNIDQPKKMKLEKKFAYSPEVWENSTVIAPTAELKKYKRK